MIRLINFAKETLSKRTIRWFGLITVLIICGGFYLYRDEVPPVLAQSAIDKLSDTTAAASGQKVLVFSPHPDDETIGVGGYIAASRRQGANIRIVLVTDGDKHHNEDVRYSEFKKATAILGVVESDLVFLGFPDSKLRMEKETTLYEALKQQLDSYSPDIVIIPHSHDANPDHCTLGRILEEIIKGEPQKPAVYEYLVHYELLWPRPREFAPDLYLTPPKSLVASDRQWQRFPLPQDIEDLKLAAIYTYQSQLKDSWLNGLLLSSVRRNELFALPG